MAGVGQVPRSPFTTVVPVLVTPAPASTAKLPAVPRFTAPPPAAPATFAAMRPPKLSTAAMASNEILRIFWARCNVPAPRRSESGSSLIATTVHPGQGTKELGCQRKYIESDLPWPAPFRALDFFPQSASLVIRQWRCGGSCGGAFAFNGTGPGSPASVKILWRSVTGAERRSSPRSGRWRSSRARRSRSRWKDPIGSRDRRRPGTSRDCRGRGLAWPSISLDDRSKSASPRSGLRIAVQLTNPLLESNRRRWTSQPQGTLRRLLRDQRPQNWMICASRLRPSRCSPRAPSRRSARRPGRQAGVTERAAPRREGGVLQRRFAPRTTLQDDR